MTALPMVAFLSTRCRTRGQTRSGCESWRLKCGHQALRIDNHFPVMFGSRRPTRPTHNDPCSPGRPYLGRGSCFAPCLPTYPLTDRLQFDILQSGPGWRGPNAIRSIETARVIRLIFKPVKSALLALKVSNPGRV